VLERTLGVPIFQEQVIKLAMVAAGFSGGEADQLRRAMAAWKRNGTLAAFEERSSTAWRTRLRPEFAERLFQQIEGLRRTTASPSRTRRASRCSPTPRPGSSATTRRPSAARC
jgi:hypothetical protein